MKRRLKAFSHHVSKAPRHVWSFASFLWRIATRWAHSAIASTCEQGTYAALRTFLKTFDKAEAWKSAGQAGSHALAILRRRRTTVHKFLAND
jgi:hypothetical protein